jgi:hypothetical protein
MGILSSAWTSVIWVWDYGIPSLFPVFGMVMIVRALRDRPGADYRLLPRRTDLPLLVPLAIIVPGQAWPSEGTYSGYCLGAAVALITVAYAVTTARVLTARHAPRLLPHRVAPRPRSGD